MLGLAEAGYDGPDVWVAGEPESEYSRQVNRYQELRERLRAELLDKLRRGELTATGYDTRAAIDAQRVVIPRDRWRTLEPDFEQSAARAGHLAVVGILVFEGWPEEPRRPDRRTGKVALGGLPEWYRAWIRENDERGFIPTREDDLKAARKALGPGVPRDVLREVRAELAPLAWRQRGRRRSAGENGACK
jgi:hypothetical protein